MSELEICAICDSPIYGKKNVRNGITTHTKQSICKEVIGLRIKEAHLSGEREGVVKGLDMAIDYLKKYPTVCNTEHIVDVIGQLKSDFVEGKINVIPVAGMPENTVAFVQDREVVGVITNLAEGNPLPPVEDGNNGS